MASTRAIKIVAILRF